MLPTKLRLRRSRGESLIVIDSRLAKDLGRFVDGSAHQRIAEARETFGIWLATLAAIRDGRLDSDEQALLKAHLGPEASEKVFAFLSQHETRIAVDSIVRSKLQEAAEFYTSVAPNDFKPHVGTMANDIGELFSQHDFERFVTEFVTKREV